MTIIADAPEGYEDWPDIRSVAPAGGGLITPDIIATAMAVRSGRRLMHRVERKPRGPLVFVHPDLCAAVRAWYAALPASLARHLPEDPATSAARETSDDDHRPCERFSWCDGHDSLSPESDGSHMTSIVVGEYTDGEPKLVYAFRYEPSSDFPEPARWSFSMPESGEWSFGPADVDGEIQSGIADLESARRAIREFLIQYGQEPSGRELRRSSEVDERLRGIDG